MTVAPIQPIQPPQAAEPDRVPIGRELLFALLTAVVVAGLGAPLGLLWSRVAPKVELVQTQYGPYPVQGEPEGYWADDGWFILLAIAMGALVAVVAWLLLRRYRGPIMLAALVVGSVAASVLGAWLGNRIGSAHYLDLVRHAPVDTHIFRPVKLRTGTSSLLFGFIPWVRGTMLVQGLAAAAVYTGLAGFHASPTLRYETMPPEYFGPDPSAAPLPAAAYPAAAYPAPFESAPESAPDLSAWSPPNPGPMPPMFSAGPGVPAPSPGGPDLLSPSGSPISAGAPGTGGADPGARPPFFSSGPSASSPDPSASSPDPAAASSPDPAAASSADPAAPPRTDLAGQLDAAAGPHDASSAAHRDTDPAMPSGEPPRS